MAAWPIRIKIKKKPQNYNDLPTFQRVFTSKSHISNLLD